MQPIARQSWHDEPSRVSMSARSCSINWADRGLEPQQREDVVVFRLREVVPSPRRLLLGVEQARP